MDATRQRELQHLGLATACAVIYFRITGESVDPRRPSLMQGILNDVAHALATLVPIYAPSAYSGMPTALAQLELIEGKFLRGAQVFRSKQGSELRRLTVQRRDMMSAISILQSARISFPKPGDRHKRIAAD